MKRIFVTITEFDSDLKEINDEEFKKLKLKYTCEASISGEGEKSIKQVFEKTGSKEEIERFLFEKEVRAKTNKILGII